MDSRPSPAAAGGTAAAAPPMPPSVCLQRRHYAVRNRCLRRRRRSPKVRQQRCANAAPNQGTTALPCSGGTACAAVPVGEMASGVQLTHARRRGLGRARARSRGAYRLAWGAV